MFWQGDMPQLVPQIAALTQLALDLDAKLASAGAGGLEGAAALHQRLRGVFDGVSAPELERMTAHVQRLLQELTEVDRRLAALRALKRLIERVAEPG